MISVNSSAARRASVGDLLIITSFAQVAEADVVKHEPQLVFVDEHNQPVGFTTMCLRRLRLGMELMNAD